MKSKSDQLAGPALFLVFVVIGVLFIIAAKIYFAAPPVLSLAVPIVLMGSYAFIVILPALRLRDDQTGDNLYYMGFLFTLTSLGVALYQFTSEGSADQIVQAFGVAIGSTIAGIFLRVLLTQMRRDPVDVERDARLELAEAARRMRRELDATVLELTNFRRATMQVMSDGYQDVQVKVDDISSRLMKSIEETVNQTRAPMIDVSKTSSELLGTMSESTAQKLDSLAAILATKLGASGERLNEENNQLAAAVSKMRDSLENMSAKLQAMQTPDRLIEIKLEPILKPLIKNAADVASSSQKAADAHGAQMARAGEIHQSLVALTGTLGEIADKLGRSDQVNSQVVTALKAVGSGVAAAIQEGRQSSQDAKANMERITTLLERRPSAPEDLFRDVVPTSAGR